MVLQNYSKISAMFENSFASASSPDDKQSNSCSSHCKKRRKQSNPTRYSNCAKKLKSDGCSGDAGDDDDNAAAATAAGLADDDSRDLPLATDVSRGGSLSDDGATREAADDESDEDDDARSRSDLHYLCPHCPATFASEDLIKAHIEEEHVLQLLERQIRQYQFGRNGCHGQNGATAGAGGAAGAELTEQQLSLLMQRRPASRASSRSSSLSQPESPRPRVERDFAALLPFPLNGAMPSLGADKLPIGMFPPFLFPVMPATGAAPGAGGGGGGGGGGQSRSSGGSAPSSSFCIFNPEAYCELCNKEFCNKYFLKTHKANKHGIYSGDVPPSAPTSGGSSGNSNPSPGPVTVQSGLQAQTAAVSAAAAAASAFFPAGLVSAIPQSAPPAAAGPPDVPAPPPLATRIGNVNPESYCDICQKAFCNK